ncbi:amino acid ABC transporter permease [Aeromicrobium endophyticum]|uniref:Amino acid ABC transporter permease n=2 Tax=Aeromicrobium endophyticum TaxID=2292704 RepID=A0A371P166_9ACTN|nr:amino acid ABC transporter permease [Aeromicrobium endophyticum]
MTADRQPTTLMPKVAIKRWGRALSGVLVVAGVVLLGYSISRGQVDWAIIPTQMTSDTMLEGVWNVVKLAFVAQVIAVVIGVGVALMRLSPNPVLRWVAFAYTWLFRGLPVLVQILLWYNIALIYPRITIGIPFTTVDIVDQSSNVLVTAFVAALLGLALNESAYMAEIVRAGLNSVDPGQKEAAQSLGMTPGQILRRVVLPQAMRVIVPPTGNNAINMIKATSLASVIGFVEVTKAAQNLSSRDLAIIEALFAASVWYMVIVSIANVGQYFLERRYNASTRDGGGSRALLTRVGKSLYTPPVRRAEEITS